MIQTEGLAVCGILMKVARPVRSSGELFWEVVAAELMDIQTGTGWPGFSSLSCFYAPQCGF